MRRCKWRDCILLDQKRKWSTLLIFALKCGALFEPFDEQKLEIQIEQAKNILEMLSTPGADEEKRKKLFAELECIRQQGNMTVD